MNEYDMYCQLKTMTLTRPIDRKIVEKIKVLIIQQREKKLFINIQFLIVISKNVFIIYIM